MTKKNSLKALALSLGLAALMAPATPLNAQSRPGGLFGSDPQTNDNSPKGLMNQNRSGGMEIDVNTQDFGQAPLGSGIAILIGAGLGYVALKKKEDEQ
ncbi:MAG: hypothetical protein IKI09_09535 [Bacteroidales bacterium]|nr:hypothetical protein [Bacteroidales bacterium]